MSQCEETEEGLHPPETTLSGEDGTQTKAWSCCDWISNYLISPGGLISGVVKKGQRYMSAMSQYKKMMKSRHPPETTLSGEHGAQTKARSDEQLLRDIPLMVVIGSSGSEAGSGKDSSDSGVSSDSSKHQPVSFKDEQSQSVESDCEVSNKSDGSDDNLWSLLRVPPIGSSCASVLSDCSEIQRGLSFPPRRRRHEDPGAF